MQLAFWILNWMSHRQIISRWINRSDIDRETPPVCSGLVLSSFCDVVAHIVLFQDQLGVPMPYVECDLQGYFCQLASHVWQNPGFSAEHCTVARWSVLFIWTLSGFNVMAAQSGGIITITNIFICNCWHHWHPWHITDIRSAMTWKRICLNSL